MGRIILWIFIAISISGCSFLAKVDKRDITPDVPKELEIVDKKTVKKELKPDRLEEIVPRNFDPSTDK